MRPPGSSAIRTCRVTRPRSREYKRHGDLMNYGDLTIQGVGEGKRTITTITSPLAFRNAITTRPVGP
jgi:hypothetical protein